MKNIDLSKCSILILQRGKFSWLWEFRNSQNHSVCRSKPRRGGDFYSVESDCVKSAKNFRDNILKADFPITKKGELI